MDFAGSKEEKIKKIFNSLKWYGHASFGIELEKIMYIDPWKIPDSASKADLILVTHSHFDHLSVRDINFLKKEDTTIICSKDCTSQLSGNIKTISPGEEIEIGGIKINSVPAYNLTKAFHPKKNEWQGYIIELKGVRVYHTGDSDFIPEMKNLGEIDIALFPVGGTYTMSAQEAAQAANTVNAKISIPMHYGSEVIGTEKDALQFKEFCKGEVRILKKTKI